jgi:hypothetical protein
VDGIVLTSDAVAEIDSGSDAEENSVVALPASPEDAVVVNKDPCVYCQQIPCDWETFGTEALEEEGQKRAINHYNTYLRAYY